MKKIVNGKVIMPEGIVEKEIYFTDKIEESGEVEEVIDAQNCYVSAGFINIHIHGYHGYDVMEDCAGVQKYLPESGVTSFLPTTMTVSLEEIKQSLREIKQTKTVGAKILGVHLEGPYISERYKGAQRAKDIRKANFEELIAKYKDLIKIVTIAPEEVDEEFIKRCQEVGIKLSIGHSGASYEEAKQAIEKGVKHITHLFNAQTALHHRKPGIVGATLETNAVCELICDNVHVHPMLQRLVWKVKRHNEIILITDSMRAAGLGEGIYELGGQRVTVKNKVAKLEDGTIAASVATMNEVMKNFRENTKCEIEEVVELVTKNPAIELNLYDRIGSLEYGKCADIVIFDEKFDIKRVFIDGEAQKQK